MKVVYLLWLICLTHSANFTLQKHQDPSAKCLDGSPAAFYYQIGSQTNKFVVYFQGGGLCLGGTFQAVVQNCYNRSLTSLGSSANYSETRSFEDWEILTSDESNPFNDWTRVFVPYCDGSVHQGSKLEPITYKDQKIYFRGSNNTLALFNFLSKKFNFFEAENIILSGMSAGGLASILWGNYVFQKAKNPDGVLVLPDSAQFILNFKNFYNLSMQDFTKELLNIINSEVKMPITACVNKYVNPIDCFQAGNLAEFIKPKTFFLQSQYDAYGLKDILFLQCVPNYQAVDLSKCSSNQMKLIQQYRAKINEGIQNLTSIPHIGAWSISCAQHGFLNFKNTGISRSYKVPGTWGTTIFHALHKFVIGRQKNYIDKVHWPFNSGCYSLTDLIKNN